MNRPARIKQLRAAIRHGAQRIRRIATFNRRRRRAIRRLRSELAPRLGVDFAWGRPSIAALKDAGASFVIRYYSFDSSKNLTRAEALSYARAGLDVVAVFEGMATEAEGGRASAERDVQAALVLARECGQPANTPIIFAVDENTVLAHVRDYFERLNELLPASRVWAYGGYQLIRELFDAGLIAGALQTYAWSDGRWDPRAQLRQFSNGHTLDGVGVDYDRSTDPYFGQWRPA